MREAPRRSLIVGWRGGVGRAVLALLDAHPTGRALAASRSLVLLDAEHGTEGAPDGARVLAPERLGDGARVRALLHAHRIDELIDLAGLDWRDALDACAATGASYLATSLERWDAATRESMLDDACLLARDDAPRWAGRHLLGSGMNPGCVNALCAVAIAELAARAGVPARADALELAAILITEIDTTEGPATDGFAMSWGLDPCLAELAVPAALYVDRGRVVALPHPPTGARYRARCGGDAIEGFVVPHDELVSLGAVHREVEFAYVYRPPPGALRWLDTEPAARSAARVRLWPPHTSTLRGFDRTGVLVCSRRFGELWCGFETGVDAGGRFGTNATLLQVAAGVVAGWAQLGAADGVRVVEQLDVATYLRDVMAVLGPYTVVHDPDAPFVALANRSVER